MPELSPEAKAAIARMGATHVGPPIHVEAVNRAVDSLGPKVLLLGGGGAGKSHSLRTILDVSGMEVISIMTEPSGMETLEDTDPSRFHWKYVAPAVADWVMLGDAAQKINTMSIKSLSDLGDIDKRKFDQWMKFISTCANYTCDRCGKNFGPIDLLSPKYVLAIDSLSGLNEMAMNMVVGMKPMRSVADWGIAMNNLEKFIITFATGIRTMGIITGHLEKEIDELSGGMSITASTLGRKLGPKVGRYYSDVIMTRREGTKFEWSTGAFNTDLKARNVPLSDHLEPSFVPIVQRWHKRIGFQP